MKTKDFLGKEVEVAIDRPLGTTHPKPRFVYEVNYGYIPNTKSPDRFSKMGDQGVEAKC